jgi:proteasome inhibitor subunit 1 (PI31)
LRTAVERAAFAVHATFLATGYSLVATGNKANSSVAGREGEPEVGIDGWDEMEDAYAFQYTGNGQPDLLNLVTVKCMTMGDSLMVDAVSTDSDNPINLEIKASKFAAEGDAGNGSNYGQQYTNLDGLINLVNTSLIGKLAPKKEKSTLATPTRIRSSETEQPGVGRNSSETGSSLIDDRQRFGGPGYLFPQVPGYGGTDLYPSGGAGTFVPRPDGNYEGPGMLVGPNDPRWGRVGVPRPGLPGGLPGVPPGARFDPYGPPGIPGFEPNRFVRDPRRPPGGHPDLEHFSSDF